AARHRGRVAGRAAPRSAWTSPTGCAPPTPTNPTPQPTAPPRSDTRPVATYAPLRHGPRATSSPIPPTARLPRTPRTARGRPATAQHWGRVRRPTGATRGRPSEHQPPHANRSQLSRTHVRIRVRHSPSRRHAFLDFAEWSRPRLGKKREF